jgi:translation initiation factor 1A
MYQTRIHNGKKKVAKHRVLIEPDEGQKYAIVQDMMGNGRVRVMCEDSQVRLARIRGSMRKYGNKTLIEKGDLVIVAMRDFEEDKVDIVHKYNYDEGTYLVREGALPKTIQRAWTNSMDVGGAHDDDDNQYIVFGHTDEQTGKAVMKHVVAAKVVATDSIDSDSEEEQAWHSDAVGEKAKANDLATVIDGI